MLALRKVTLAACALATATSVAAYKPSRKTPAKKDKEDSKDEEKPKKEAADKEEDKSEEAPKKKTKKEKKDEKEKNMRQDCLKAYQTERCTLCSRKSGTIMSMPRWRNCAVLYVDIA